MDNRSIIEQYRMVYDHHTHTTYSHGTGSILDNARIAHEKGLKSIAITDHGPGNFFYGMKMELIPKMREDIKAAREIYPDVKIFLGVEANTILKVPYLDVKPIEWDKLDIVLAGYHFAVFGSGMIPNRLGLKSQSLLVQNTDMILNALYYSEESGNHIDILTHPGDKGPFDIDNIARACEDTGTLMEINGKHPHLDIEGIKTAAKYDVKFVISSDAHVPENVGVFEPQLMRALEAGLDPERIVNIAKR
ncbi:MAG: PHP domain-containing protein [Firmicutes bacterium]|jgi:putative hydrolase|nr:PHP domain-containing protein [Bacillota bacterium]